MDSDAEKPTNTPLEQILPSPCSNPSDCHQGKWTSSTYLLLYVPPEPNKLRACMWLLGNNPADFGIQFPVFDATVLANWASPPTNNEPLGNFSVSSAAPTSNAGWQMMDDGKPVTLSLIIHLFCSCLTNNASSNGHNELSAVALGWEWVLGGKGRQG